jgi:uncharacterized repeat protein (TIGR03803 family)
VRLLRVACNVVLGLRGSGFGETMSKTIIAFLALTAALSLPAAAQETPLYSFTPQADGNPVGSLVLVGKSELFGTTAGLGGSLGTVFELQNSNGAWTESTVFTFDGTNGANPLTGLIADPNGALFGTTSAGGSNNGGTAFELTNVNGNWSEQTLWNFGRFRDGAGPSGSLLLDSSGALYGTTQNGGAHKLGTVFKLTLSGSTWTESVLYSFAGGNDGKNPLAGLVMDSSGRLYGTTYAGGASNAGTVFALTPSNGKWTETVIHSFGAGIDGRNPGTGPLLLKSADATALYGTTLYGGLNNWGTAFEIRPNGGIWTTKTIYTFTDGADGGVPSGALTGGGSNVLYGTTLDGGKNSGGTVYALTQSGHTWTESVVSDFPDFNGDGSSPAAAVTVDDRTGILYGTTASGGSAGWGTAYQIVP